MSDDLPAGTERTIQLPLRVDRLTWSPKWFRVTPKGGASPATTDEPSLPHRHG